MRLLRWLLTGLAAMSLVAVVACLWLVQSDWLREKIRVEIIRQVEKSSGGRAELRGFSYDWHHLTVQLDRFVLHGSEAANQAPLLAVERITLHLRIISLLHGDVRVQGIDAERPQTHLIVYPDGRTNIPGSKIDTGSARQKILDLKIAFFNVRGGTFTIDSAGEVVRKIPWSAHGEDLAADMNYDVAAVRYAGDVSVAHLHVLSLDFGVAAKAVFEQHRILVSRASLKTSSSDVELTDAMVNGFKSPVTTARYDARVSLAEAARVFGGRYKPTGNVAIAGDLRFASLSDYSLAGLLRGQGIDFDKLRGVGVSGRFDVSPARTSLTNARLTVLGGELTGSAETSDFETFRASGTLAHFDLREIAKIETRQPLPYDGLISGPFEAHGRVGRVDFDTHLNVSPAGAGAPVKGDVALRYDATTSLVNLGESWIELPHTRVNVSGTLGDRLNVKLQSTDFRDLMPALDIAMNGKPPDVAFGSLAFDGIVSGAVANPVVSGRAILRDGRYETQVMESFTGDVALSRASATVSHAELVYRGIQARGAGSIGLTNWSASAASPITATIEMAGASVANILKAAGHKELEVSGTLNTTARVTGSLAAPLADADFALTRGLIYGQPFDSISGRLQALNRSDQAVTGTFVSGPKRVNITARFDHAGTQFPAGTLEFNLTSNTMPLNQISLVRQRQPDIRGFGKFHADGVLKIGHDAKHDIQFNLASLNADASANGVELDGRNLGDAHFTALTKDDVVTAHFDSNAAKASIRGEGTVRLTGDYPTEGKATFSDAGLNSLAALIVKESDAKNLNFDGTAEGAITFRGALLKPDHVAASFDIPRLELHALPGSTLDQSLPHFAVTNTGPIRAKLANSVIMIESAHFKAPETDVTVDGSIALSALPQQAPLNLRVQGTVNLALAQTLNSDLTSAGSVALNATIRGGWAAPEVSGRAAIRNGDFHYAGFSNGLTGANGDFVFTGSRATIESFSAQSGGGKVSVTGFAALGPGVMSFRAEARARDVRVRYPEGISSVSDADLTFAGTSERSQTSGAITVHRVSINPKSDAATILANAAEPTQTPASRNGFASNMNLDVQISTAPDVSLQTSVTESLQADANLRLRGTATNPALLGRINVTQGEMVFFGNKYSINTGSISFLNPVKIDPILNIDLETKARGVDVILTVSGPINKLNVSYRSDPPLQFSDVVALLATGRAPTGSTLAVRDTGQSQNFQQLGASALIGQAIANPVAGRLQRFFGVSRLKIDPSLTGITGSPEARLTIEQQITPEILFTYITDVSSTSTQLIRVEWSFNPRWSAILIREENGYVGLDFAFKKRFK